MVLLRYVLLGLLGLMAVTGTATATMSQYRFMQSAGTPTDMTGATVIYSSPTGSAIDETNAGPISIGFPFVFDGIAYTTFNISENGLIRLGNSTLPTFTYNNDINNSSYLPVIAPLWDDYQTIVNASTPGYVRYKVTGSVGRRVLTVEWRVQNYFSSGTGPYVFQARVHEFDGRIEFVYVSFANFGSMSASIGLADATTDWVSVTPGNPQINGTATTSSTSENNSVNVGSATAGIPAGTMYTFYVCSTPAFAGDVAEGGTPSAANNDLFFQGRKILVDNQITLRPLRITNSSGTLPFPIPAQVRVQIVDPRGYFSVAPTDTIIAPGTTFTPRVTFNAYSGAGRQTAQMIVTYGCGEVRAYDLEYTIDAPAGEFKLGSEFINEHVAMFVDTAVCVAEEIAAVPISVRNTGVGNLIVRDMTAFMTDTVIGDGTPGYPLLRDDWGNPIRTTEYFLSRSPYVGPPTGDTGIIIPEGATSTIYVNFKATRPELRTGRVVLRTNARNFSGTDLSGTTAFGTITFDVFGRGVGSHISALGGANAGRPKSMLFGSYDIGTSALDTFEFINGGVCNLHINRNTFRFESGDVREFEVVGHIINAVQSGNNYLVAPGDTGKVIVRFTPSRSGSRTATMRLVTNDSSLQIPGVSERGVFYWEVYGQGKAGLDVADARLTPAVIDGEAGNGEIVVANEFSEIVKIDSVRIMGGNGEFMEDPTDRWPTMPHVVLPGTKLRLGIVFNPATGSEEGERSAEVLIYLSSGDTARARVVGYAGTRTLEVAPAELFTGVVLKDGEVMRRFFTLTNTGTLPVTISDVDLAGDGAADYRVSPLRRATLQPGQTEYFEVTYAPSDATADDATITIVSNATNGDQVITLSGDGVTQSIIHDGDHAGDVSRGISGVEMEVVAGGLALGQSTPNPARGMAGITYRLARAGDVTLRLYDGQGRLLRLLDAGERAIGEHTVRVDVSNLPSGEYHYRLEQAGTVLTRTMIVTH